MTEEPLTPNTDDIGARARTAVGWRALSQFSSQGIQIVVGIILARLLMPSDFGIIGMAGIVTGLAGVFQDLGFGQALVQRAELRPEHSRSAFWMTLIMGTLLYTALYLGAPSAGEYFHDERMVPVLRLMALSFLISPFGVVPRSLLQRELDFRKPFYAGLAGTIANGGVGITMALLGYGYWSLVWALLVSSVVGTIALCIVTHYAPPVVPSLRGARELFAFGAGATGVGLGYEVATRIDYIVIGRLLDATALGLYTRAYNFVIYPVSLTHIVTPIFLPAFSRMQHDINRMRDAFGRATALLATLFWPALAVAAVACPELITVVFGGQWEGAVVPAQILILVGMFKIVSGVAGAAIKAAGRVYGEAWRQALHALLIGIGAWFGARHGIVGVACGVLLANLVHYTLIAQLISSAIGFGPAHYSRVLRVPIVVSLLSAGVSMAIRLLALQMHFNDSPVLLLTLLAGLGTATGIILTVRVPELQSVVSEVRGFASKGLRVCLPVRLDMERAD